MTASSRHKPSSNGPATDAAPTTRVNPIVGAALASPGALRPLLRLALPVFFEESLNLLVGYTDWWLTGHYLEGSAYQAAMGLMAYLIWLLMGLFSAVAIGASALVGRFVGAGNMAGARRVAHQALLAGVFLAAVLTAAAYLGGLPFIRLLRLPEEATPLAWRYLFWVIPAIPAIMLEQVAIAILRGAGDTVTGLYTKVVVNFVNAVCSAALLLGWGGLPALGWEGLAIGTSIGHAVGAAILLAALIRGRDGIGWRLRELTPDWGLLARMFRVGGPGGLDVLAVLGCHLSYVSIINTLGTDSAAAHGLGVELEAMAYAPASSFAVAASAMTGLLLGANEPRQAGRAILTAAIVAILFCSTMGFIFYHSGWVLVEWFVGESSPRTALLARDYLRIVSFSMPFLATTMVLTGALRGAGDTLCSLAVTFTGLALIRVPGAAWLAWSELPIPILDVTISGWNLGVQGAWWAMVIDVAIRSTLLAIRFATGGWKRVRV